MVEKNYAMSPWVSLSTQGVPEEIRNNPWWQTFRVSCEAALTVLQAQVQALEQERDGLLRAKELWESEAFAPRPGAAYWQSVANSAQQEVTSLEERVASLKHRRSPQGKGGGAVTGHVEVILEGDRALEDWARNSKSQWSVFGVEFDEVRAIFLRNGMRSGKPSCLIAAKSPQGSVATVEMSVEMLMTIAAAFKARYELEGFKWV